MYDTQDSPTLIHLALQTRQPVPLPVQDYGIKPSPTLTPTNIRLFYLPEYSLSIYYSAYFN